MYFYHKINVISATLTTGLCSTYYCEMHNTIKEGCKYETEKCKFNLLNEYFNLYERSIHISLYTDTIHMMEHLVTVFPYCICSSYFVHTVAEITIRFERKVVSTNEQF